MPEHCLLHTDRPATRALNIPCAPSGRLWVCDECYAADPGSELRGQLFKMYLASHEQNIIEQRAREERQKGNRN